MNEQEQKQYVLDQSLWETVFHGRCEKVRRILNRGSARVDGYKHHSDGRTALMVAIDQENLMMTSLLLEGRANLNHIDYNGLTALIHAIKKGNMDITRLLLESGADIDYVTDCGKTTVDYATTDDMRELLRSFKRWERRRNFLMFLATQSYTAPPLLISDMSKEEEKAFYIQFNDRPATRPSIAMHEVFYLNEMCRSIALFL